MRNISILYGIVIISITGNLILGTRLFRLTKTTPPALPHLTSDSFPYLSKRIFVENQNDIIINFIPLRAAMREYIGKQQETIGVYFEYLPSGISIGINDQLESQAGSLMKIPVVMGAYKQIELGKLKKQDILTIQKENLNNKFGDLWKKGAGTTITVEDAIQQILVNSDNTALNVLRGSLSTRVFLDVLESLDIHFQVKNERITISPKSYSSILRSLYLSSYLKETSSNEIISILTQTPFSDKLVAGVPATIKVAHKIGVFTSISSEVAFSDCGIIYATKRPYILCIMVRSNEEKARQHMSLLSKMVYGYIAVANN